MKLTLSFLFGATILGLVASRPQNQKNLYYNYGPHYVASILDSQESQNMTVNQDIGSIPREWTAEFLHPFNSPDDYSVNDFLSLYSIPDTWCLKPYSPDSNTVFNSWNIRIRVPIYWRAIVILQSYRLDNYYYADFFLDVDKAGAQILPSHCGDISSSSSWELLELDPSNPMSLVYKNNKLTVRFTTRNKRIFNKH